MDYVAMVLFGAFIFSAMLAGTAFYIGESGYEEWWEDKNYLFWLTVTLVLLGSFLIWINYISPILGDDEFNLRQFLPEWFP